LQPFNIASYSTLWLYVVICFEQGCRRLELSLIIQFVASLLA